MAIIQRSFVKPPFSAWQFNPDHLFSREMVMAYVVGGGINYWKRSLGGVPDPPEPIWGKANPRSTILGTNTASIIPSSNREGEAIRFDSNFSWIRFDVANWLPIQHITILIVRRKLDTTNRSCAILNSVTNRSALDTSVLNIHLPWSDGIVYFDFGGNTSPNRLSIGGLSFSTTIPERWIFTAGERGMSIWQNGIEVANSSTAVTRTTTTGTGDKLLINCFNPSSFFGDIQEINFLQINDVQWNDELCRVWSAEPYAHLYSDSTRYLSAVVAASVSTEISYAYLG